MVICLQRGADLHMAQLMPLPLTVSCSSKIQIGFTFLVPAHLGSHGKEAVKWLLLYLFGGCLLPTHPLTTGLIMPMVLSSGTHTVIFENVADRRQFVTVIVLYTRWFGGRAGAESRRRDRCCGRSRLSQSLSRVCRVSHQPGGQRRTTATPNSTNTLTQSAYLCICAA